MVMRFILIIAAFLLWANAAMAATLNASVDRKDLTADEHITFTLSLINSNTRLRAEGISPNVDLSVLATNFDLGTPSANNRFNLSREGGRSTSSITVDLFPKRAGRYTLPPFQVDGQSSQPITINVRAAPVSATPELFVRSGVNKTAVWTREQTIVYLELLHRVNLDTASLGGDIETAPLRVELLEYRKLPQIERKEQIAGMAYNVQRITWALFPTQSGNLTVHLPDIWAITANGRRLRLPGGQHQIQVKALPPGVPADMLVGKPDISQSPLTILPDINSLTSWNIRLRAPVSDHALPATLPGLTAPPQIKLYLDNAQRKMEESAEGVTGIANYTVSVTPLVAGEFRMPAIRIPYFDPQRGAIGIAESPGQTLVVKTGPEPAAATSIARSPSSGAQSPVNQIKPESARSPTQLLAWQLATLFFAMLWLATLMPWLRARALSRKEKHIKEVTVTQPSHTEKRARPLQAILLEAFGSQSLEQGLSEWEQRHSVDHQLRETVQAVQRLYYGKEKTNEESLWPAVQAAVAKIQTGIPSRPIQKDKWSPDSFASRV